MSDLENKVKELEKKLDKVAQAYGQDIMQLKTTFFQQANRFEALLRYLITGKGLSMDQFLFALEEYQRFRNKLISLAKEKPMIVDRVNDSVTYNETAYFKIYADDLDLASQIEAAGGTSPQTAKLISEVIPLTDRLRLYLKKYLVQIPELLPEPGADGIVVSSDYDKELKN